MVSAVDVSVLSQAVPADLLDGVQVRYGRKEATALAASPNYWVTLGEALHSPRSVAEQIVGHLYRTISSINENKSVVGAEYWVQVVIIDQRFDGALKRAVPDDPTWSVLSFPLRGNYCLFSGDLGHGVLDGGDDWADRITLLVNWWDHQPEAVGPAPLGETILASDDAETVPMGKQLPIPVVHAASSEEELQLIRPRGRLAMVKLTAIMILKYMGPDKDPLLLGSATDLSSFGFFQRSTVREMLVFVSRTVARKTVVGTRQSVQHQEYFAHAYNRDGLVAVVFADADYPARAGFCVATAVLDEFVAQQGQAWRGASADEEAANPVLETALQKFQQDPAAADKLAKIQRDLDETKIILHKTIESVLDRGEKLDQLVEKSNDLGIASQMFYKQAKKANSCCSFM
ncbi:hypothetical protein QBZ16_001194 [Prototheca wickerhamii]|uniref:Uncharacterized protein n=1 Tax=Prototheca wickerhamii TaxID=3111 RepID=A0AAD9MH48_PROWI|nr:hypothetical protein QBZ16_001194 [Prototheca wickerhamii]